MSELVSESETAKRFGVPRAALKELRATERMREGEHWARTPRGIMLTPAGVTAVFMWAESEKKSSDSKESERQEGETAEPDGAISLDPPLALPEVSKIVTVTISRIWQGNDRRMRIVDEDEREGVLQVRTTRNFMVGMRVPALRVENSKLYHYRGPYPRAKGRL